MTRLRLGPVCGVLTARARRLLNRIRRWRWRPPEAGVREPRRPKPTLPGAAVALAEPRTGLYRWVKLLGFRPGTHRRT